MAKILENNQSEVLSLKQTVLAETLTGKSLSMFFGLILLTDMMLEFHTLLSDINILGIDRGEGGGYTSTKKKKKVYRNGDRTTSYAAKRTHAYTCT